MLGLAAVVIAATAIIATAGGSNPASRKIASPTSQAEHKRNTANSSDTTVLNSSYSLSTKKIGPPGNKPVPILMYHVIGNPPAGAPFPGLYVPASEFAGQMSALAKAGYHGVTQDQMWAYWKRGVPLPPGKPIIITFDNGYKSQYAVALPVLQKYHWPAVENIQLTGLPPSQGGLLRKQTRAMVAAGWELDTQGFSHADLVKLTPQALQHEVADSRHRVQKLYKVPANWFCYPSGHYNPTVISAVKKAGYIGSTTTMPGWNRRNYDPYKLERLRVLGGTTPNGLINLIQSYKDHGPPPASFSGG